MALNFYARVAKGLKLKVRKFWWITLMFVEVKREKLVGGLFDSPPLPPILNRVKNKQKRKVTVYRTKENKMLNYLPKRLTHTADGLGQTMAPNFQSLKFSANGRMKNIMIGDKWWLMKTICFKIKTFFLLISDCIFLLAFFKTNLHFSTN